MTPAGLRRVALAGASLAVVVACGTREVRPDPAVTKPPMWERCGEVDCGTLRVPLDHFSPTFGSAGRIGLRVYRHVSSTPGSRHLPLVIHPGGPGADVRGAVVLARNILAPIIDDFDIYALSTRGTVDGVAFDCGMSLDQLRVIDEAPDAAEQFAGGCNKLSPNLVGRMGTRQSVADLEELRRTLGLGAVRFLGWSYGATLGAAWAMTHPESIRVMVLDAPTDPHVSRVDSLRQRYASASQRFARSEASMLLDGAQNKRELALAREFLLYEPSTMASAEKLVELRLGETPDGNNDGGIETQIGVHCSDFTHDQARSALAVIEPEPQIGFGAAFDRVCLELGETNQPLSELVVDDRARRIGVVVVSTSGDHVIPAEISRGLARSMSWDYVEVVADRHLSIGFDAEITRRAMTHLLDTP